MRSGESPGSVLQVTHRFWPVVGGSESYLRRLARDLVRDGRPVVTLTTDAYDLDHLWGQGYRRIPTLHDTVEGSEVLRFPVRHPLRRPYGQLTLKRLSRDVQRLPGLGWTLSRWLSRQAPAVPGLYDHLARRAEPDRLVHAANILFDGFIEAALVYARRRQIPLVVTPFLHLGEAGSTLRQDYVSPRQIDLFRRAAAVVVQTDFEARWLAAQGIADTRLVLAPDGPDLAELAGGDAGRAAARWNLTEPYVLYLGPAVADKGFFHLGDAVHGLANAGERVALVAAGPLTAAGQEQLDRADPAVIRHLGTISDAERNDLLAGCLAVALPSRTESLGRTVLEGWFYERPAIAAAAGALTEVVRDGETGLLVRFGDQVALATAIRRLLHDPETARRLGRAGRSALLDSYQWTHSSARLRDLFARLSSTDERPTPHHSSALR